MFGQLFIEEDYTSLPNDMYLICDKKQNNFLLLKSLIEIQGINTKNGHGRQSCYATYETIGKHMMISNKNSISNALKWAVNKQYVQYIQGERDKNTANEYWVDINKIVHDIHTVKGDKAYKEMKESQQRKIARCILIKAGNKQDALDIGHAMGFDFIQSPRNPNEMINTQTAEIVDGENPSTSIIIDNN